MPKRKRKQPRPWWKAKWLPGTVASVVILAVIGGFLGWAIASGSGDSGGGSRRQFITEPASPFTLSTTTGGTVSLSEHLGKHNLLLFFNEGVGCDPCYQQIADLEKDWGRFRALDIELVSVMVDPMGPGSQLSKDVARFKITTSVASDVDRKVSNAYDAMTYSMHPGQKPGHSFILVDKAGSIAGRWDWPDDTPMYRKVGDVYKDVSKWLKLSEGRS